MRPLIFRPITFCVLAIGLAFWATPALTGQSPRSTATRDLYHVSISTQAQAEALSQSEIDPILRTKNGYLVLADPGRIQALDFSGIAYSLVSTDVSRHDLALDISHDRSNAERYPVVYEEGGLRLVRVTPGELRQAAGLAPILSENIPIVYRPESGVAALKAPALPDLDSLLLQIQPDSLQAYIEYLQSVGNHKAGTYGSLTSALWLADRLRGFGYESVVQDTFTKEIDGESKVCRNVVASKPGSLYPYDQIIIGAHRDAIEESPGADDNGSGTAGVLEIARVLQNVDTRLTFIFILFDAEEEGLLGGWHYANSAAEDRERIALMLNMDMIGNYTNQNEASVDHANDTSFAHIWTEVAATYPSINLIAHCEAGYVGSGSDQAPFYHNGYDVLWINEYDWSTVFHTPSDSTTYLNFDYMARMARATMATALVTDGMITPAPDIVFRLLDDPPPMLLPGLSNTLEASIEGYAGAILDPGSARLHYTFEGQAPDSIPMLEVEPGIYRVAIPVPECLQQVSYYLSAEAAALGPLYCPPPDSPFISVTATGLGSFEDDFETDKGWSVWGDAAIGHWERDYQDDAWAGPAKDFDGSGMCYVTGGDRWNDVDRGTTYLKSPPIELPMPDATIEFAIWFYNHNGSEPQEDILQIDLYNGDAETHVMTLGPVDGVSWQWQLFRLRIQDYFFPTAPISIRFAVSDTGARSFVAAGIDAFRVTWLSREPVILTEHLPVCSVGVPFVYQLAATACDVPLTWSDEYGELIGTGLTLTADGAVSGTPLDTGRIIFTALAADAEGASTERRFIFRALPGYLCGDANHDGSVNVGDAVHLINYVFRGGPTPSPVCVGDANADDGTNVGDAVYLINFVFKGGSPPQAGCCP